MKLIEGVFETRIGEKVVLDDVQFGFRSGKSTDAMFVMRQMAAEKLGNKGKKLWIGTSQCGD